MDSNSYLKQVAAAGESTAEKARQILHASGATFVVAVLLFATSDSFSSFVRSLETAQAVLAGAIFFLLAYPVGYLINAASYFFLGWAIEALSSRSYGSLPDEVEFQEKDFPWFLRSIAVAFELQLMHKHIGLKKWKLVWRASNLVASVSSFLPGADTRWDRRMSLLQFARNLALIALVSSGLFFVHFWWKESVFAFGACLLCLALATLSNIYARIELLNQMYDLYRIAFAQEQLRPAESDQDCCAIVARMLNRIVTGSCFSPFPGTGK